MLLPILLIVVIVLILYHWSADLAAGFVLGVAGNILATYARK